MRITRNTITLSRGEMSLFDEDSSAGKKFRRELDALAEDLATKLDENVDIFAPESGPYDGGMIDVVTPKRLNRCRATSYPGGDPENGPKEFCTLESGHSGKHRYRWSA